MLLCGQSETLWGKCLSRLRHQGGTSRAAGRLGRPQRAAEEPRASLQASHRPPPPNPEVPPGTAAANAAMGEEPVGRQGSPEEAPKKAGRAQRGWHGPREAMMATEAGSPWQLPGDRPRGFKASVGRAAPARE